MRVPDVSNLSVNDTGDWRDQPVDAWDVENAYRMFLGREAENEDVVTEKIGIRYRTLLTAFLLSGEFIGKAGAIRDGMLTNVDQALLAFVQEDAGTWLRTRLPFDATVADRIAQGASRLELIGAVLARPEMGADFDQEKRDDAPSARDLAGAIARSIETAAEIGASPLFDPDFYRSQVDADVSYDLPLHYLLAGERNGLAPSSAFDPLQYSMAHPHTVRLYGNLLLHYERDGRAAGFAVPSASDAQAHRERVAVIRKSELFDPDFYAQQLDQDDGHVGDLAAHYFSHGERRGLRPSRRFNPAFYAELYADIRSSDINRLLHFEMHGRAEGRAACSVAEELDFATDRIDPAKETILLLLHEASHTGAPILGWNIAREMRERFNVVVVFRAGGTIEKALAEVSVAAVGPLPPASMTNPLQLDALARALIATYRPRYAIANSVETRHIAMALRDRDVAIVALIHEFASTNPQSLDGTRSPYYSRCAAIIFPAELVRQSSIESYREITIQNSYIIPQGPSDVPAFGTKPKPHVAPPGVRYVEHSPRVPLAKLVENAEGGPFTIIGLGSIELRKGIDLFIAAGTALLERHPDIEFQMIWIGNWDRRHGTWYNTFVEEQAKRSGLGDRLHFFAAVDDLEPIYRAADALLLSSRLDPLPNVGIDAAMRDVPIFCFRNASGLAELFVGDPLLSTLVAPHLDSGGLADRIAELARDPERYRAVSTAIGTLARQFFDMNAYTHRIDQLGKAAANKLERTTAEHDIIVQSGVFEDDFYLDPGEMPMLKQQSGVSIYLDRTRQVNYRRPPIQGAGVRRPIPGFHPFIYGSEAAGFPNDGSRDALAHYFENGAPAGPWRAPVIRPLAWQRPTEHRQKGLRGEVARLLGYDRSANVGQSSAGARAALHGHFYYTDDIEEFVASMAVNETRIDLFLTTSSEDAAEILARATASYAGGKVVIDILTNVGRDIGPFIWLLEHRFLGRYDVIGHIHGKKSVHTAGLDVDIGKRWRQFLWRNLLGPDCPAADAAIAAFEGDPHLGLVFPQNDFTVPWDENFAIASDLAARMNIPLPLPSHIEFPVGTMFWARSEALRPLLDLHLKDDEYPSEPLPNDGTILHALERMLPIVAKKAGYSFAMTYMQHVRR